MPQTSLAIIIPLMIIFVIVILMYITFITVSSNVIDEDVSNEFKRRFNNMLRWILRIKK